MIGSLLQRAFSPVVVEETVAAPPDAVYAVLADPETYPGWLVGADRMRSADPDFPEPGTKFEHSVGLGGPLTVDDRTESVAAEPNHHLGLRVHAGPFHGRVDFHLFRSGEETLVRLSEVPIGAMAALTPLLRRTLSARNRRSLDQLGDFVTSRAASSA